MTFFWAIHGRMEYEWDHDLTLDLMVVPPLTIAELRHYLWFMSINQLLTGGAPDSVNRELREDFIGYIGICSR